MTDEEEPK